MPQLESAAATPFASAAHQLPDLPSQALRRARRLPGEAGPPLVGHTLGFLLHTQPLMNELRARHGPNFRMRALGNTFLVAGGPDAVRELLLDREKNFSSERGWGPSIGKLFARGLILRDFEEHRLDRRIVQVAFRTEAMRGYVAQMNQHIAQAVPAWPRQLQLYPAFKQLTLDMASRIFLGLTLGEDSAAVNRAFIDAVAASIAVVRRELPLLAYGRGMRGRRVLEQYFSELIRKRRAEPGNDLLSELCRAKSEDGERFGDDSIRDQMIFLMMAAHDTTTSSLTSVVHALIENPGWQERVRDEIRARGGAPLGWDERGALPAIDHCFDEALRLYPPVPFIPRRTVRACTFAGLEIPANVPVVACPLVTHRLPEHWSQPDYFDPDRFAAPREEHAAHSHLYYPFGGGAHICLGLHFARIQVKAVLHALLGRYRIRAPRPTQGRALVAVPIPYPRDGLPALLEPLHYA